MSPPAEDAPSAGEGGGNGGKLEVLGTYAAEELGLSEEEQGENHHIGFNRALEDARLKMKRDPAWHGKVVRLRIEVWITDNPGAVGEYRVWASHP